jgi:hypothetical protein
MTKLTRIVVLLAAALIMTACGGETLTAEEILTASADAMTEVETVSFVIEREGEPFVIDPENGINAIGADGVYRAPSDVYATVQVTAGGFITDAEVIWLQEGIFLQLPPLIPEFTEVSAGVTFDPALLFSAEQGIPAIMRGGLTDLTLVGQEDLDGLPTHHITASADPQALSDILGGAIPFEDPTVDLWVNRNTDQLVRVLITEVDGESTWLLDFFGYGEPVEIPTP